MIKNTIYMFFIAVLAAAFSAHAEDVVSEDFLLGNNVGTIKAPEAEEETPDAKLAEKPIDEEAGASFWTLIKKPLALFKSTATDEIIGADGKKETFLEKSIRQANEGRLDDQLNLGYMYLYGTNGVEQNVEKSFLYYKMAAAQNDPVALNNLGSLYFSGIGTEVNTKKALKLFLQAAELGNDNAAVNLAFIYLTGGNKDMERNQKAIALFERAAEQGNNIAKFMLGYAYYRGFFVKQDYAKAYKLIRATASENVRLDEAQIMLGQMLISGKGTVQNYQNGVSTLRLAVSQGNPEAMMLVAQISTEGQKVPQNLILAHALYNIAASMGIKQAAIYRDAIGKKLKLQQLSQAQTQAEEFKAEPSELTTYVHQAFGPNIRKYIDYNM